MGGVLIRIVLLMIIAMMSLIFLQHYLDVTEENFNVYNQRLITITYYKQLFNNIINSGLLDDLYEYDAFLIGGDAVLIGDDTIYPLYVLNYYDEDSAEYEMALQYFIERGFLYTTETVLDYSDMELDYEYLHYFQQTLNEFEQATGVSLIVYYDMYKVYEGTCNSVLWYEFESVYFDNYGFMHIVKIIFC